MCLSSSLLSGFATCAVCDGPLTIAGSRKRDRCYGCSRHRNRGTTVCTNDLLESVTCVDRRVLKEIERTVLTPAARRIVLEKRLSPLGDVLASDQVAARQALAMILDGKVRFTPVEFTADARTYRFEAKLALGRILGATRR